MKSSFTNDVDRTKRILHFVLSKGSNGASLKEVWLYFSENGDGFSPASIISQLERLSKKGLLVETRQQRVEGYQRRFFDPRFVNNAYIKSN